MNDLLKGIAIGSAAAIILAVAGYFYVRSDVNNSWELRLAQAHHQIDSLMTVTSTPVAPIHIETHQPAMSAPPDYRAKVDSAYAAGLVAGKDSLRALVDYWTQPEDTTLTFPVDSVSADTLRHKYFPLTHVGIYDFARAPIKKEMLVIHDSVAVGVPIPEPWYKEPAVGLIGYVLGAVTMLLTVRR